MVDWAAVYAAWNGRMNRHDCWELCSGAHRCCRNGQTLLLAPGEGDFLRSHGVPAVGDGLWCEGREKCFGVLRPLCCRTFPFHPSVFSYGPQDEIGLLANTACSQHRWASLAFIEATRRAWRRLLADDGVRAWAQQMRAEHWNRWQETPVAGIERSFAQGYTENFGQYVDRSTPQRLREAGVLRPGDRVLDVGCGEGINVAALLADGVDAWGVDVNPWLIGRSLAPDRCRAGDVRALPFADRSFDLVYCVDVLEHLADYGAALREMARVSRRDVYVKVTTTEDPGSLLEDPTHVVRMSTGEWRRACDDELASAAGSGVQVRLVGSAPRSYAGRTFMGFMRPADGYGIAARRIGGLLAERGWDVLDMIPGVTGYGPEHPIQEGEILWHVDGPAVVMCGAEWTQHINAPDGITLFTMFESTRLPRRQVECMNAFCRRVIVPCDWCAETFVANGVRAPISVVGLGVEAGEFPAVVRDSSRCGAQNDRPYTFLWSGTPDLRKGWDVAYRAFWQAFQGDTDYRLIMHFRKLPRAIKGCGDTNVELVEGRLPDAEWLGLLARADAFVFPSRGEGWGQPPREAAMTGLPAIVTNWSGLAAGIQQWALPLRVARWSEARFGFWEDEDLGEWAEPDVEHLAELMLWCAEHPAEAAARGQAAAAWLRVHATWEETARRVESEVVR